MRHLIGRRASCPTRPIATTSHGGASTSGRYSLYAPSSSFRRATTIRVAEEVLAEQVATTVEEADILHDEADTAAAAEERAQQAKEREREVTAELLQQEVGRRRNFAIISHPDAGKTTLVGLHSVMQQVRLSMLAWQGMPKARNNA